MGANQPLLNLLGQLPIEKQWELAEIISGTIAKHNFVLTHPDRPAKDYAIDYSPDMLDQYIPAWAPMVEVIKKLDEPPANVLEMKRHSIKFQILFPGNTMLKFMDGKRTIRQCLALAAQELNGKATPNPSTFNTLRTMGHIQFLKK